ncbi:MAG TPA: hypothetical protein VKT77_05850 [Chthonomonadaceae bacterium]|nr:hypothetical protein [Chthonomonadaceae bacterium]
MPPYTEAQILVWCDAHFARHGKWPNASSGPIPEAPGENWSMVSIALNHGIRGITRRTSLAKLLLANRGVDYVRPALSVDLILIWCDSYFQRIGQWPTAVSEPIEEMCADTWIAVDQALRHGTRGIGDTGGSLARLLEAERGKPNRSRLPKFSTV